MIPSFEYTQDTLRMVLSEVLTIRLLRDFTWKQGLDTRWYTLPPGYNDWKLDLMLRWVSTKNTTALIAKYLTAVVPEHRISPIYVWGTQPPSIAGVSFAWAGTLECPIATSIQVANSVDAPNWLLYLIRYHASQGVKGMDGADLLKWLDEFVQVGKLASEVDHLLDRLHYPQGGSSYA